MCKPESFIIPDVVKTDTLNECIRMFFERERETLLKYFSEKEPQKMTKKTIFEEAEEIVSDRLVDYGHPTHHFKIVASFWRKYLNINLKNKDIAIMMILFKIAREKVNHKRDNLVDIAGYVRCLEILEEEKEDGD